MEWNRNNWISWSYSEQICREMNAWYLWAFHRDKKNLCVIKAGVKQQMKYLYSCFLEAFFLTAGIATHCLDGEFGH